MNKRIHGLIAGLLIGPCVLGWVSNTEYIKIFEKL